jgi:hypothetical protein
MDTPIASFASYPSEPAQSPPMGDLEVKAAMLVEDVEVAYRAEGLRIFQGRKEQEARLEAEAHHIEEQDKLLQAELQVRLHESQALTQRLQSLRGVAPVSLMGSSAGASFSGTFALSPHLQTALTAKKPSHFGPSFQTT